MIYGDIHIYEGEARAQDHAERAVINPDHVHLLTAHPKWAPSCEAKVSKVPV